MILKKTRLIYKSQFLSSRPAMSNWIEIKNTTLFTLGKKERNKTEGKKEKERKKGGEERRKKERKT